MLDASNFVLVVVAERLSCIVGPSILLMLDANNFVLVVVKILFEFEEKK